MTQKEFEDGVSFIRALLIFAGLVLFFFIGKSFGNAEARKEVGRRWGLECHARFDVVECRRRSVIELGFVVEEP
jgi:hypothetical protein